MLWSESPVSRHIEFPILYQGPKFLTDSSLHLFGGVSSDFTVAICSEERVDFDIIRPLVK